MRRRPRPSNARRVAVRAGALTALGAAVAVPLLRKRLRLPVPVPVAACAVGPLAVAVLQPQPEIHIRGDSEARYESVGRVVATAQRASILKIGFITEPPPRQ